VFVVVGGGLRWQKNDGGCCGGDCSSSYLCRGSNLYFSLSPSVLIAFPPITVFVSFPSSPCLLSFWYVLLLFLFSPPSLPLSLPLCSPLFSFVFVFFWFLSSIPYFLPHFLFFSFLFCFFVLAILCSGYSLFFIQSPSFSLSFSMFLLSVFLLFLRFVSQSFLTSISHRPVSFSIFSPISPLWFFRFFPPISPQNSPPFALIPLLFIRVKKEREAYYPCPFMA